MKLTRKELDEIKARHDFGMLIDPMFFSGSLGLGIVVKKLLEHAEETAEQGGSLQSMEARLSVQDVPSRGEIAMHCMSVLMASDGFEERAMRNSKFTINELPVFAAEIAVQCADALLVELKKGGQ